ncbi:hypothetical protein M011DRAFT_478415 [Sporormia fimetaria CBS 119925]|uniref:Uncharacterized protein n=1 Tax=Sporormia fimetaria CBS 119925 TaxID=1340428 RepID=A0A6A6V7H8_9PLEO|nr:hypothetical protein M011DRAFT_478415 [Sporormia fimetaria CBS 119925]
MALTELAIGIYSSVEKGPPVKALLAQPDTWQMVRNPQTIHELFASLNKSNALLHHLNVFLNNRIGGSQAVATPTKDSSELQRLEQIEEIEKLKKKLEKKDKSIQKFTEATRKKDEEIKKKDEEIKELRTRLKYAREEASSVKALREEIAELKRLKEKSRYYLEWTERDNEKLKSSLKDKERLVRAEKDSIADLNTRLRDIWQIKKDLTEGLQERNDRVLALQIQVEDLKAEVAKYQEASNSQDQELHDQSNTKPVDQAPNLRKNIEAEHRYLVREIEGVKDTLKVQNEHIRKARETLAICTLRTKHGKTRVVKRAAQQPSQVHRGLYLRNGEVKA